MKKLNVFTGTRETMPALPNTFERIHQKPHVMTKSILIVLLVIVTLSACKKKSSSPPDNHRIEIAGKSYPTVEIGSQVWTAENYDGVSEITAGAGNNLLNGQKAFSIEQIKTVNLPAGWRIPTKADFEKLLRHLGQKGAWASAIFGTGSSRRTHYEFEVDTDIAAKLLSREKWSPANTTNSTGFNGTPHYEDTRQPPETIIGVDYLCSDGLSCFLSISMLRNESSSLGGMLFHSTADDYPDLGVIRFVKDK